MKNVPGPVDREKAPVMESRGKDRLERFFRWEIANPWKVLVACTLVVTACAGYLPTLQKDMRSDAFLAPDHPAKVYRDVVKEQFGLTDPLVLVVLASDPPGIFRPEALQLIDTLTGAVAQLDNINASRVVSIATENNIIATSEGMEVTPFLEEIPGSISEARALRADLMDFPLYVGALASPDGKVALITAELVDEDLAEATYREALDLLEAIEMPEDITVHVAGEGAVMGYLASYVDADAQRLIPVVGLMIVVILAVAFRRTGAVLACVALMAATLATTLGIMAAMDVPIYVISNALPVILVGIAVADGIHIFTYAATNSRSTSRADLRESAVATMVAMWRPVTLTTLTTMAGFLALYLGGFMPPFRYFGLFAAIGVGAAWVYSMTFLPIILSRASPVGGMRTGSRLSTAADRLGRAVHLHARKILFLALILTCLGVIAAANLRVDDDPIELFQVGEPVVVADQLINRSMRGSNTFDIVIETTEAEALFDPGKLRRIEELQAFVNTLPHIGGSSSLVDYVKQMNRSMHDGSADAYAIPDDSNAIAQYFLIYSVMSDPSDFEDIVDHEYRLANIRVNARAGGYSESREYLEPLKAYLTEEFNTDEMQATVAGRVNLNYLWIKELAQSHFRGLSLALALVWLVSAALLGSFVGGLYVLAPVVFSVVSIYVAMVCLGITLGMGTAMFAAIAIGLGIDFSVHTVDRFRELARQGIEGTAAQCKAFYRSTGLALLFNVLAIAGSFGVLVLSQVASLNHFGIIMVVAISTSFVAAMTLLPAMLMQLRPAFVFAGAARSRESDINRAASWIIALLMTAAALPSPLAEAAMPTADEIVARVNANDGGPQVSRKLTMTLTDRHGKQREREVITFRKTYEEEERTVVFFEAPANVRGTAFLIWDYVSAEREDDQWLYLPALRRTRRISAVDRGDYFLGTDFTYEDIKLDGRLEREDYDFSLLNSDCGDDCATYRLVGIPRSEDIANELGYSRMEVTVDPGRWVITKASFWDLKGNLMKTLEVSGFAQIDGTWTRTDLLMRNHLSGHSTRFQFTAIDYQSAIDDGLFTRRALERGL